MKQSSDRGDVEPGSRSLVSGRHVRVGEEAARVGQGRKGLACSPRVDLVREGDVVQAIEVTCSCGETIRLKCVY